MRRQNPPQVHLQNAQELEKYLRPGWIIPAYAIAGSLYIAFVAVTFVLLIHDSMLNPTHAAVTTFAVIGLVPTMAAVLFCFIRPHDPLSSWINRAAKEWRQPLALAPEECTFKELLGNGDGVCIKISLIYPVKHQSQEIKERLYVYVKSSLGRDCSLWITAPTFQQVEEAIEPALEIVASECGIPVLYSETQSIESIQADFNFQEGELASAEFWRTGT